MRCQVTIPPRKHWTMASRRVTVSLAKASLPCAQTATTTARIGATAQLALSRRCHGHAVQRQPARLLRKSTASPSPLLSSTAGALPTATRRYYSTDAPSKPHKIWDFEAVRIHAFPQPIPPMPCLTLEREREYRANHPQPPTSRSKNSRPALTPP
ncbi:hypothetical protein N658DRAFT_84238 [Parathielavia hyrcaniae]|uniref:Uncharacterized protein n=1 Tax=Parathielavia hyrcaniae TaxID=113614 RepID=A0AAN6T110_9PEZI|nr:hypothetical protein N658DRAFT_84238 [Parathielavia hyrcaniae]